MKTEDILTRLAVRMKEGDEDAAGKMYDELYSKVYGFAMNRVRRKDAAEEITQEIFMKLVLKIGKFDENAGPFAPWFWRLAANTVTDFFRSLRADVFSDLPQEKYDVAAYRDNPEAAVQARLAKEKLDVFLDDLSTDEKEAFELRFVAELPYRDIALSTGRSEGSLRVAVSRVKNKIKKHFTIA